MTKDTQTSGLVPGTEPDLWIDYGEYRLAGYSAGSGGVTVMLINGGPGLPSYDIRDSMMSLVGAGYRVVSYDQLGTGMSDKPDDPSLWTIERYSQEVEVVRKAFGLTEFYLLGHSWGGMLAVEYAVTFGAALKGLVLEGTCADARHFADEARVLARRLGDETITMMTRREKEGTMDHPEYRAAITLLEYRHIWRTEKPWTGLGYQKANWNRQIYEAMQGPNEFLLTGNLRDWSRIEDLKSLACPALIIVGEHDHMTPDCSRHMHVAIPNSRLVIFRNCGHVPRREFPDAYLREVTEFLCHPGPATSLN